tara:strand:- start:345 stop:464 length:120 start_codon:yes stop_codon:yes gene_type:complete
MLLPFFLFFLFVFLTGEVADFISATCSLARLKANKPIIF